MPHRHSLLVRQIRRHFGNGKAAPEGNWQAFLDAVNQAYHQSDTDRALLERSMDLSSQELIQANSDLRAIFQAIPDLFFRFAADGTILDCKAGHPADLLLPVAELAGKRIQDIPVPDVGRRFEEAIREVRTTGSMVRLEYCLVREGRRQLYEARLLPLRSQQMIAIIRNITELKETEEALRQSEEERARLQTMGALGHLVGSLAHEVRNPLFAISATLETLMMELDDPRYEPLRRPLENLREPTARLSELMSELLEYGKPLSQNLNEGSLHEVVQQAVADCEPLAAERRIDLRLRLGGGEPRIGMVRHRLLMALSNLVQNAVQHTPAGGTVLVEVEEIEQEGGSWARCGFKDSGKGFRTEDLPRIFEPFFTRRRGGTGLGLSIVQRVAEEHRARLAVGNRPEGGAVVTLEIPRWP
jgi:signal transduction histidine kinase